MRRAALTFILLGACMAGAYSLYNRLPSSFLPSEDKGNAMVEISLPTGATLTRTDAALEAFREQVQAIPGVRSVPTISGTGMMSGNGENAASTIAAFDHWDKRTAPEMQIGAIMAEIQRRTEDIAEARIMTFATPAIMGLGKSGGANFLISGSAEVDTDELSAVSKNFAMTLSARPETLCGMTTFNADTPQLQLSILPIESLLFHFA